MVDEHINLSETSVGKELTTDIMAVKVKYESELEKLKVELVEAKKAQDTPLIQELNEMSAGTTALAEASGLHL